MVDTSTVGLVSVSKRSGLETSPRELSEDVPFRVGNIGDLACRAIVLGKPLQGCDITGDHNNQDLRST